VQYNVHNFKVLFKGRSPYQTVTLGSSNGKVYMYLDDALQFVYPGERTYHRMLIDNAISLLGKMPERVLILGGGDGMAARNAFRYEPKEVIIVEIDPLVLHLSKTHPIMKRLNQSSLNRAKVIIRDAYHVPYMGLGKFDIIAMDLTEPDKLSNRLYSKEFTSKLITMLKTGGVLSAYANDTLKNLAGTISRSATISGWGTAVVYYYKKET